MSMIWLQDIVFLVLLVGLSVPLGIYIYKVMTGQKVYIYPFRPEPKCETESEIIKTYTTGKFLGIFGEPAVNVLKVNLALDGLL